MKKLSYWAKNNSKTAIMWIVFLRILLGVFATLIGIWVGLAGFNLSLILLYFALGSYIIGWAFYPKNIEKNTYKRQKKCDSMLVAASFFFWMAWGNWCETAPVTRQGSPSYSLSQSNTIVFGMTAEFNTKHHSYTKWVRWIKRPMRAWVTEIQPAPEGYLRPYEIGLMVLGTLLLACVVGGIIAALSCTLLCNGQEALAIFVLLGGVIGLVICIVALWRSAIKGAKRRFERAMNIKN